jgi:dihydroxy-acid dehydratase
LTKRIDDPHLDVTANDVLVLKNAGPKGAPGMPEAGYLPIPKKLAQAGVKDMVRISDAQMSGTAFGTIVLHITPEAADGGPLAIVQNGDWIVLDVEQRRIHLEVADEEIQMRLQQLPTSVVTVKSGYRKLYLQTVTQADLGCDFDFMMPELTRVAPIPIGD